MKRNAEIGLITRPSAADRTHLAADVRRLAAHQAVLRGLEPGGSQKDLRQLRILAPAAQRALESLKGTLPISLFLDSDLLPYGACHENLESMHRAHCIT